MPDPATPVAIRIAAGYDDALRLLTRGGGMGEPELPAHITALYERIFGEPVNASEAVRRIVGAVRERGDEAVREFTLAFDGSAPDVTEVPRAEWDAAWESMTPEIQEALELSARRIRSFHEKQPGGSWIEPEPLGIYGQLVRPLTRVGLYAPAGTAPLPSTLLMTAVPARVAGVEEIVLCSPPTAGGKVHPIVLAAARVAGVDRVFGIGGAQAIAAMAFGTATVPQVDKIL
ncbi:MAG TPA: histidinol dehydrogenase, partial [Thermomicrobiales bacterium]|nr:histidinol dehydrogenase [Thermomicrobiales bacterium]